VSKVPESADVVVIGGGFAGAATAWALARRGIAATVLEREQELGMYASGRSAGLGRQLAEDDLTSQLTIRGAALIKEHFPATWKPTGGVLSFDDPALADAYVARAARLGVAIDIMDQRAVLAFWPTLVDLPIAKALFVRSDGVIEVKALLAAYAAAATVIRGVGVTSVAAAATGATVTTTEGTIAAKIVVDAAGAWAGATTQTPPLVSYKRHLFILAAEAIETAPFLWHLGKREMYVRGESGLVLASPCDAARIEPADQQPDLVGESHLRSLLDTIAEPELADAAIIKRWACHRSYTEDRKMRLARDAERPWLVWAAGLGGHGATASAAVGERVAEIVAGAL